MTLAVKRADKDVPKQRGAVLVEAAISIPIVFLLIFAVIEFGFVFRDYVALTGSTNDAIRMASISGDDITADHRILQILSDAAAPLEDGSIRTVVIFEATGPGDSVPAACLAGSQSTLGAQCNTYSPADFARPLADFGCDAVENLDDAWCPSDREVTQANADYIGIHVVIERDLFTGFFGDSRELSSTAVLRIEPRDL